MPQQWPSSGTAIDQIISRLDATLALPRAEGFRGLPAPLGIQVAPLHFRVGGHAASGPNPADKLPRRVRWREAQVVPLGRHSTVPCLLSETFRVPLTRPRMAAEAADDHCEEPAGTMVAPPLVARLEAWLERLREDSASR